MKRIITTLVITVFGVSVLAAENTPQGKARRVEVRADGHYAFYLTADGSSSNSAFVNQGCDLDDRAVLLRTTDHERLMMEIYALAVANGHDALIRVDGCMAIHTESALTAPLATKIQIFNN